MNRHCISCPTPAPPYNYWAVIRKLTAPPYIPPPDRLGLETLAKSRDVRPRLGDGLLYRRQRQGSAVLLCTVPCLCDPDRILVRRIARDYVAAATRHRLCSPQQDIDYHIALAGFREHFANQSVHGSRLRS